MLNRPSIAVNKWAVVLIGALLAILVLSNPAQNGIFAHPHEPAQDDHDHIYYDENGTGEVRDFDLADPEGSAIEWNVRGVDAADFDISSAGVLTFMESPDFENPTDRAQAEADLNGDGDQDDPGEAAITGADNEYQITVSATEMSDALPAKRTDIALTVTVENADDPGELILQWLQPEVATAITAILTDPDGDTTISLWTWYTSKVGGRLDVTDPLHWTLVAGQTTESYTPVAADEGRYLRVHVAYTDPHGSDKTMNGISMNPVRAEVSSGANASPDFQDDVDTRSVPESTVVGDPVGDPVTATDTDNDTVTYELIVLTSPNDGDDEFFDINRETGQIAVAQELDYDAVGDRTAGATASEYKVKVRATDPSGLADNITVTITAENVNEAPIVTGRAELSVEEGADDGYTILPDAPATTEGPEATNQRNEYVYTDPDYLDSIARWHLEGDDAGAFDHSGRFEPRYLQFKMPPDYENPTDMNRDNVYEVTLVATDTDPLGTSAGIGRVNVWLIVTNVEEAGKVVFTEGETAFLDEMLVAEVQDPDDHGGDLGEPHEGVHILNWQWSRALNDAADTTFDEIDGATTNRYTPRDMDRGHYLRATARYTDPLRTEDVPSTPADERIGEASLRTVMATTENAVKLAPGLESAPTFSETGTVTREVAEDTAPDGNVGAPVAAMAATGGEVLAHTLAGPDAEHFVIGGTDGQIKVGTDTRFDYEDPSIPNTYRVTVKVEVTGGDANQKAEVDVVIRVTDVNELPMITDDDVDADPMTAVDYPEIDGDGAPNTAAVATYVGTDPEGATISWDLRGADAALFTIAGGVLQFVAAPDYENPKDVIGENTATATSTAVNNIYDIVIRAIASRAPGDTGPAETVDTTVAVTVTDVDEDGEVVISWLQPEVGIAITASLTDADGPSPVGVVSSPDDVPDTIAIAAATWTWEVSEVVQGSLNIDNEDHWGDAPGTGNEDSYTPAGADLDDDPANRIDEGKYLRVTASYTDRHGATKTAHAMSAYPVQARGLGEKNQSPDFEGDKVELSVAETAEVGDEVPGPVVATVVAPSNTDILTYGLRAFAIGDVGSTGVDEPSDPDADVAAFDIDKETGQITVAQKLNFESRGTPSDGKYVMVATVTDPSNLPDSIVVVITAEDMNEDPVLSGRPELTINEIDGSDANADNPDFVGDAGDEVNVYNVVDEDRRAATEEWRLEGQDAGEFQLIGNVGRTLVFRNQPDYENPADANGDNVYKVTVVTFDGDGGRGDFDVCIAVMNINEDGKITLLDEDGKELVQPRAQGLITASLTDPDEDVTEVTWQWARSQLDPPVGPVNEIAGAESATYTPSNTDTSYFLRVTAMYTDGAEDITAGPRTAVVTAMHAVLEVEDLKGPPAFPEDTAEVQVAENSPSTTYVGEAIVAAVDPEGATLIYTLEGDDTAHFELVPDTLQIRVKAPVAVTADGGVDTYPTVDLNHEDDKKNTYTIELKASDGALDDTITVTITVTDRNEAPMFGVDVVLLLSIVGDSSVDYAEDSMDVVATYEARGIEADNATWSLSGADAGDFRINNAGEFTFATEPDYEAPADADTDNVYEVTIVAMAETATQEAEVTVTVTNVDETGSVILSPDQAVVGVALVADLSDPDIVVVGSEVWQWARENDDGSYEDISGATSESYTPVDGDNGRHLRVTVTYDDEEGSSGRSLQATSDDLVTTMRTAGVYDVNNDGMIDKEEARAALTDYFNEAITKEEARAVITLYFMTSS